MSIYNQDTYKNFIGQGITFPIHLENGKPPLETGAPLIRASIRSILSWEEGDRFFLAEFASRIESLLFEPNDFLLKQTLNTFVGKALQKWEPRINITSIVFSDANFQKVDIHLSYQILTTNLVDTYIFPFYRNLYT